MFLRSALLLLLVLCSQVLAQRQAKSKTISFGNNECFAKGGIGIVAPRLFIDLKSAKNELIFGDNTRWTGKAASDSEVAIFFHEKVWSPQTLPRDFDLSKAAVVSFEAHRIRFFNFDKMSGGFYHRAAVH